MTHYFDLSNLGGCVGIIASPGDRVVYAGTQIHREPVKYRGSAPAERFARENDLHVWFDDEEPDIEIYTVPKTGIGGYDSTGGLFAGSPDFSFRDGEPMYYIDRERNCYLITENSRDFPDMGLAWREKMVPTDAVEIYSSREEAMEAHEIHIPRDDDDLMNMLKKMDKPREETT